MGPFGGAMVSPMLPELARGLDTSVAGAAGAITAYMLPFSGLMLVSGTLSGRWRLDRVVRASFLGYAAASLLCAVAAGPALFLLGRGLQGGANAFTTPLLLTLIGSLVPPEHLGRALGTYAGFTAAGQAFAPLVGGAAAGIDYRWAFVAVAAVALGLAALTRAEAQVPADRPRWRALANPALARASGLAFAAQVGTTGVLLLAALVATDRFGMPPAPRGLVVAGFGVAGFLSGRLSGRAADRFGVVPAGVVSLALLALGAGAVGVVAAPALLVAAVLLAGAAAPATRVLVNSLALQSTPTNRAGATSTALSVQFLGAAAVPTVLPLYEVSPGAAAAVVAAVCLGGILLARR